MFRRVHTKFWGALFLIALTAPPRLFAEELYAIRLARHKPRIEQEYELKAELQKTEGSIFKSESRSQDTNTTSSVELLAHCKVLTKAEHSQSVQLVIQRLIERQSANTNVLLLPGTVVTAKEVASENVFTADGVPLSSGVSKVLGRVFGASLDDSECTADQAFGTPEPKKIGDSWKANTNCMAKGLSKLGIAEPNQFDATTKLLGVEEGTGTKCLRLSFSVSIHTDKPVGRIAKDPRSRIYNAKWDTNVRYSRISLVPIDEDLPCLGTEEKVEGVSKVEYNSGTRFAVMEMHSTEQKTVEIKLLR